VSWRGPRSLRLARAVRAAGRLTGCDWAVLVTAAVLLPVAALAVKLVPLARLLRAVQAFASRPRRPHGGLDAERIVWLVDAVPGWCVPGPSCLARALVAFALLRRRAIPVRFVIGITKARGALEGHAWVEVQSAPAATRGTGAYVPLLVVDGPGWPARAIRSEPAA
jgi:Transglutaminase-like superfamily